MANQNAVSNAITKPTEIKTLSSMIEAASMELGRALPKHMSSERLVRIALTCIRQNPKLAQCTPASFMGALFTSAQLGIEPINGLAYLLPFNNSRKVGEQWTTQMECQFMLGYKGLANLFYRHEKALQLAWGIVYKNDTFEYEYGTEAFLHHRPTTDEPGPVIGYYVIAELTGNARPFRYMTQADCLTHGMKHSKTYDKKKNAFDPKSPWYTNLDSMCLKTVLIQLHKLLPLSFGLHQAIATDETSREYKKGVKDALELPDTTNWDETPALPAPGSDAKPKVDDYINSGRTSAEFDKDLAEWEKRHGAK